MTNRELRSYRRKISLLYLVKEGEMSFANALDRTEDLFDEGKIVESDYSFLADFFERKLEEEINANSDNGDIVSENTEEGDE